MNNDLYYEKEFTLTAGVSQELNKRWRFHEFYSSTAISLTITMPNGNVRTAQPMSSVDGYLYEGAISSISSDTDCTLTWIGRA